MFVFDPLQHPNFRRACRSVSTDPQLESDSKTHRQDEILQEAAKRIRQKSNLAQHERVQKPLIVVVNKYDVWGELISDIDLEKQPIYPSTSNGVVGINIDLVLRERVDLA